MRFLKVYGTKNNVKELIFGSIEIEALVSGGVKTAQEQGYLITDIIELPQVRNNFVESDFTFGSIKRLLERAVK